VEKVKANLIPDGSDTHCSLRNRSDCSSEQTHISTGPALPNLLLSLLSPASDLVRTGKLELGGQDMHLGVIRASDKCRSKEPLLYHSNDFNDTSAAMKCSGSS